MFLAVFNEFAHPEVLGEVKRRGICEVDIAANPIALATSPEETHVVRTNAKLITVQHTITGMRDPFDSMDEATLQAINEETDKKLEELTALGFVVKERHPKTSAGCPMLDRVILSFPE